jgi:hypothetical protein
MYKYILTALAALAIGAGSLKAEPIVVLGGTPTVPVRIVDGCGGHGGQYGK